MTDISWLTAFAAGRVSFLSPCVLPLVPGYVSFMSGLSLEELSAGSSATARKAGVASISFVLGFALVFTLLGATASAVGQLLSQAGHFLGHVANRGRDLGGVAVPLKPQQRLDPDADALGMEFLDTGNHIS